MWIDSPARMRLLPVVGLTLLLLGCVHHAVRPSLATRHCAEGSYPVKASYHDEVVTVCAIIAPECASKATPGETCPIVGFLQVGEVNTFLDPDADEAAKEKDEEKDDKRGPWWKLWHRRQPSE